LDSYVDCKCRSIWEIFVRPFDPRVRNTHLVASSGRRRAALNVPLRAIAQIGYFSKLSARPFYARLRSENGLEGSRP
jgi:hypothetical protein